MDPRESDAQTPRRTTRREFLRLAGLTGASLIAAACAPAAPAPSAQQPAAPAAPTTAPVAPAAQPTTAPAAAPTTAPVAKAAATAVPKARPQLGQLSIFTSSPFPAPTAREQNTYLQEIEKRLGVQLNFTWVPNAEYSTKLAAVLASGDIADVINGNPTNPTVRRALAEGAFLKLQDFGLPKETRGLPGISQIPEIIWKNSGVNGTIFGVPTAAQQYQQGNFLRKDWLDALSLQVPKTTAELKSVLEAFVKQDPDKNGKADSVGFSIGQRRAGWLTFQEPFGVAQTWALGADGKLVHHDISDAMKAAVSYLRELYAAGVFNKDFPTINSDNVNKEFASGLSGGFNQNLASGYDLQGEQLRQVVKTAVVLPIDPVDAQGFKKATQMRAGYNTVTQIHAKFARDPELVWEVLRVIDFWIDPSTEDFVNFGFPEVHHKVNPDGSKTQTEKGTADIQWLRAWSPRHYLRYVDAPYVTKANKEQVKKDTDRLTQWGVNDPTWGIYPNLGSDDPTQQVGEFANQMLERMVRGEESMDNWAKYVADWKSRGGQRLMEVTQAQLDQVKK